MLATDAAAAPEAAPAVVGATPAAFPRAQGAVDDEPLPFGPKHRARSRAVTAAWGVGALVLLVALAAQAALWFRGEARHRVSRSAAVSRPGVPRAGLHRPAAAPDRAAFHRVVGAAGRQERARPAHAQRDAAQPRRRSRRRTRPSSSRSPMPRIGRCRAGSWRRATTSVTGSPRSPLFPAVSEHSVRLHIDATSFKPTGYRLFLFHP